MPLDERLWQLLAEKRLEFQVVLTKIDLLDPRKLHASVFRVLTRLQEIRAAHEDVVHPIVHAVSARHNFGIPELRASLSVIASDARKKQRRKLLKDGEVLPERLHR